MTLLSNDKQDATVVKVRKNEGMLSAVSEHSCKSEQPRISSCFDRVAIKKSNFHHKGRILLKIVFQIDLYKW